MTTEQWEHENQDTLMEYFIDGDPSVRRIQCEHCRKIIYTQTRNRKYCSFQTCGHKMLNLRKSIRKRIERGTYTCPCCGEQFLPMRADARYCSNACRQKDYRQRKTKRYEGYGAQRIATYLNNAGYRARSGKCWHPGSLRGMVGNLTYMGVLRCGDARSELIPELQIIPQEEFEAAQRIREDRSAHAAEEAEHHVPLRTRGQALLSNNVYCGHCGARLALTTSRKWRKLSDGTLDDTLRIRYTCYGKLRKQTNCTGQTGYTMHILDEIIDKMVRQIFSRLRGIPKEQLIISRYAKETAERKNHLQALQAERDKAEKDLLALKAEILAVIKGESAFPKDTLAEMIAAQEKKHTELETLCEEASAELERNAELMANVSQLYEELISYADLYDSANFEAKKMIVSQLIRRVDVYRRYQIHVDFNFDLAQYLENSDELAC